MTKQEYLTCPICGAQTKDYFISTSESLITDVKCTNRKCFFSSNYVPINVWDRYIHMVKRCYTLEADNARLNRALDVAAETLNHIACGCPKDECDTCVVSGDCTHKTVMNYADCWREYALAEAEEENHAQVHTR